MSASSAAGRHRRLVTFVAHNLHTLALCILALALAAAAPVRAAGMLSGDADFKLLATLGFEQAIDGAHPEGSQLNEYAWSMTWFKGKLYVGTGRFETDGTAASLATMTGQIWAYTPGGPDGSTGRWAMVLQAPMGLLGPREFGYRWMTVCNFGGTDYLFVSTAGIAQGNILRTTDGLTFTPVTSIGYPVGTVGFRTMVCFTDPSGKRLLVTTPVGKGGDATTYDTDVSDNPVVLVNENPVGLGTWRTYSPMRFNDSTVDALFTLYAAGGFLYAGADSPVTGAQLWRTPGCTSTRGNCTPIWTKVVDGGGGRPFNDDGTVRNYGISDLMAFGGAIYMGISTPTHNKPPAEMLRLRADGTFEVVIGEPRMNFGPNPNQPPTNPALPANLRCGVPLEDLDGVGGANDCPPTSRHGAGFGPAGDAVGGYPSGPHSYFWRIHHYAYHATNAPLGDNRLYAGTLQGRGTTQSPFGFDIVASTNGVDWVTVTNDGLGVVNSIGMRAIATTPLGLAVGSANRADPGNNGGCSIWLGIPSPDSAAPVTTITSPPSPAEGDTLNVRTASFSWTATDTPGAGSLPLAYACRLEPLEAGFSAFGAAATRSYAKLPNGTYTFHVIARDAAGNTEAPGAAPGAGNRRTFTVSAPDLAPTVGIQSAPASPNATGSVSFGWTGSDDLTPTASLGYDFWLAPLQADPGLFTSATTASYTSLADGTYTFHVLVKDGGNNVSAEATHTFTVTRPVGPPPAPASASAVVVAPRVIRVSWPDVAGESSYDLQRCMQGGRSCSFVTVNPALPANTTSYDDPVGAAGTYRYQVRACNTGSCSAYTPTAAVAVP
ncbi:MAG: hypothetical protein U1F58_02510 [Burkholderiales bacterium]